MGANNRCVHLGADLFNHSKGLFFSRALDRFSGCQYNMSFHVRRVPDISNGWSDIVSGTQPLVFFFYFISRVQYRKLGSGQ